MAIGDLPNTSIGDTFASRDALAAAGVHRATEAGITGASHKGAESIVLSGGYPDDRDEGDVIIYTAMVGAIRHPGAKSRTRHSRVKIRLLSPVT
jgi:putative restriction endonuclease